MFDAACRLVERERIMREKVRKQLPGLGFSAMLLIGVALGYLDGCSATPAQNASALIALVDAPSGHP